MNLFDRVAVPAHVMARKVGPETVILDLAGGTYFGLDPVGARIWQLMGEGLTLADVCTAMLEAYDVTREVIEKDVLALATLLEGKQLVSVASAAEPTESIPR